MRIEVRSSLAAADALAGQGVLKDLLEAEELDDSDVDRRMEAQAALVGAERRVELNAEAAVDLDVSGVVDPRHAEDDLPFGLDQALQKTVLGVLRLLLDHRHERVENLAHGLVEFEVAAVACDNLLVDFLNLRIHCGSYLPGGNVNRVPAPGRFYFVHNYAREFRYQVKKFHYLSGKTTCFWSRPLEKPGKQPKKGQPPA